MKLVERYNWINLPILSGIFLLSGLGVFASIHHLLISRFDDSLKEQAQLINRYIAEHKRIPEQSRTDEWRFIFQKTRKVRNLPAYTYVEFYDADDREQEKFRQLSYSIQAGPDTYQISISKSLEPLDGLSQSIALVTVIATLVSILITLVCNQVVLRRLWAPFYSTLEQLKNYRVGTNQAFTYSSTQTEEFVLLDSQIDDLLGKANREYQVLKEFTENASHELQTPLSIVRAKLDLIIQEENLNTRQQHALGEAYEAVSRMSALSRSLLLLSKIENSQFNRIERVDLHLILQAKVRQMEELWRHKKLETQLELQPSWIEASPELIEVLINNLLGNAVRHNIPGGQLRIMLKQTELHISNTGVPTALDSSRMFKRFYRPEGRTDLNGTGLGLSIIKQICEHSGIDLQYNHAGEVHTFSLNWAASVNANELAPVVE